MAEQYFQAQPSAQSRERRIQVRLGETSLCFFTDNATFSKEHLDEGSRILLEALPPLGGRVADLGCGWGPIGCFAAAKNPEAELLLLDVNQRAAELARRNILENGLKNAAARAGDGSTQLPEGLSAVLTNPPIRAGKKQMYGLFAAAERALLPGGRLYVVIRKNQGAPSAQAYLEGLFERVERVAREKGFWVLCCTKAQETKDATEGGGEHEAG